METVLLVSNSIVFFVLGIIWTKTNFYNFTIKCLLMAMALSNIAYTAGKLGYIVKV